MDFCSSKDILSQPQTRTYLSAFSYNASKNLLNLSANHVVRAATQKSAIVSDRSMMRARHAPHIPNQGMKISKRIVDNMAVDNWTAYNALTFFLEFRILLKIIVGIINAIETNNA